ncbi:hypothetical protein EOA32_00945 [Mesorhizobium sp. M1A.F.Ca.ET.072.01.1.1]|uniref:phage tail assembly chaperone n=1 Tax=Mesorhizobium sp. M1A.F.Ca.ET.072.01.1.1 TaxID=2496753 RepID=UPI000FD56A21|nr:hypothetical protein [Mesorhizobium sp. M1A.F.Ca.ET.072.01.1.1]RUW55616.1 hypothetical protein EOA32_00945 [Mesorhizobium sp. M1A.F.Ca.ET.072.01.1.1]
MEDENGETRRKRNEKFDTYAPPLVVPLAGLYLWRWFFQISEGCQRIKDGVCVPIPPSEYIAWRAVTGEVLEHWEFDILRAMDAKYCAEMNIELEAYRERQREKQKVEADRAAQAAKKGRRGK